MGSPYMPPLVDRDDEANRGYPPTNFGSSQPPIGSGYSPFTGAGGDGGGWSGAGWGEPVASAAWNASPGPGPGLTAAGYPTSGGQPFPAPLWSQSAPPWNTPVQQQTPTWPYPVGDPWRASPYGANSALAPISNSYNASPFFANTTPSGTTKYLTPLAQPQSLFSGDYQGSSRNMDSISSYGIRRSSSVGARSHIELARRPRDWRPDFKFRAGFAGLLPRRQRTNSSPSEPEFYDVIKRDLHRLLQYNSFNPPVFLDLRDDPMSIKFHGLGRPFDRNDLLQYACEPPVNFMRLYHDKLPWYIDVWARNGAGVTIHDLFDQMSDSLKSQISNKHFYNEELDDDDRAKVTEAFKERCAGRDSEIAKGVRRIDFLRGRVVFEGISRGRNGMWELKTRKM